MGGSRGRCVPESCWQGHCDVGAQMLVVSTATVLIGIGQVGSDIGDAPKVLYRGGPVRELAGRVRASAMPKAFLVALGRVVASSAGSLAVSPLSRPLRNPWCT